MTVLSVLLKNFFINIKWLKLLFFIFYFQKELAICALSNALNQPTEVISGPISKIFEKKSEISPSDATSA